MTVSTNAPVATAVVPQATADDAAPCPVYRWCDETGEHFEHMSADLSIPSPKADEPDYLTAYLMHLSGCRPMIGLGGADLDAGQVRQEARNLREFAGRLENMAAVLDATRDAVDSVGGDL